MDTTQAGQDRVTRAPMRAIRRYAHELYPHAEEGGDPRPLAVEVPYFYARAIGLDIWEVGASEFGSVAYSARLRSLVDARLIALLADALLQNMTGQDAWDWVDARMDPEAEVLYDRAAAAGVDAEAIKLYPCGPEPDHHGHHEEPDPHGFRLVAQVRSKESQCSACCTGDNSARDGQLPQMPLLPPLVEPSSGGTQGSPAEAPL